MVASYIGKDWLRLFTYISEAFSKTTFASVPNQFADFLFHLPSNRFLKLAPTKENRHAPIQCHWAYAPG